MDGFWTVEFGSSTGIFGGGVVVIRGEKIVGGDAGYFYIGDFHFQHGAFSSRVQVSPFIEGYESVFKTVGKSFLLELEGSLNDPTHAVAQGRVQGFSGTLAVRLTKRTEA